MNRVNRIGSGPALSAWLVLFCSCSVQAADNLRRVADSWPVAPSRVLWIVVLLIVGGAAVAVGYEIHGNIRKKRRRNRISWDQFNSLCNHLGLNTPEINLLRRIIHHADLTEPELIFKQIKSFETGVAVEIAYSQGRPQLTVATAETIAGLRAKLGYERPPEGSPYYSSRELAVGHPVFVGYAAGQGSQTKYKSKIHDLNERELILLHPGYQKAIAGFNTGDVVQITLYQPGDAEYAFKTRILGQESDGQFLRVGHVVEMDRRQLREYVRFETKNEAFFRIIRSQADPEGVNMGERRKGVIMDISGGGVNLRTPEEFHIGDTLLLNFNFLGEAFHGIRGKILRISPKTVHGEPVYQNHIEFREIDQNVRERIIKLIFKKQREELQWQ